MENAIEPNICKTCVWHQECMDKDLEKQGYNGCSMTGDIVAMSCFSIEGQPSVRYFSPTATKKVKTIFKFSVSGDGFKYDFAFKGVRFCERHQTIKQLWESRMLGTYIS